MSVEALLWEEDATGLAARVRAGDATPGELVEAAIARLEAVNPEINAVAEKLYEEARRQAETVDRAAPLAGVPFAIKDLGMLAATARFDAVLMPLIAHPPLPCGAMDPKGMDAFLEEALDRLRLTRLLRIDRVFDELLDKSLWFTPWPAIQNVSGQPAVALPVHVTAAGLPLGVQAAGRPGDEETLLSLAAQMEKLSGWRERRAPLKRPA